MNLKAFVCFWLHFRNYKEQTGNKSDVTSLINYNSRFQKNYFNKPFISLVSFKASTVKRLISILSSVLLGCFQRFSVLHQKWKAEPELQFFLCFVEISFEFILSTCFFFKACFKISFALKWGAGGIPAILPHECQSYVLPPRKVCAKKLFYLQPFISDMKIFLRVVIFLPARLTMIMWRNKVLGCVWSIAKILQYSMQWKCHHM